MSDLHDRDSLRDKIIGLGENSTRKSYYPELQKKIKELEDREKSLYELINNILDGIIIHDEEGTVLAVNDGMLAMYHLPDKETALQYTIIDYSFGYEPDVVKEVFRKTIGGKSQIFEWRARRPLDNSSFESEVSARTATWQGKKVIIATIRDITERLQTQLKLIEREQQLECQNEELISLNEELAEQNVRIEQFNEQLKIANSKAVESDRLKTAFLANMSHEIRTPLNGILGFTSLLPEAKNSDEAFEKYISVIQTCSNQLLTLIDDIIDLSKIEAGMMKFNPQLVNINSFLQQIFAYYKNNSSNLELICDIDIQHDELTVFVDQERLRQLFNNLLNNAMKFTSSGKITFGYHVKNQEVEFYVSDTGIGIAPENTEIIFEHFRQADVGFTKKYRGTGLGLAICKSLLELMGGRIWVDSQLDVGSTFYFTVPLSQGHHAREKTNGEQSFLTPDLKGQTILVAEDEEFNFMFVKEILSKTKVSVVIHAEDGQQAIEMVEKHPEINLIFMDIKMPNMNGIDATMIIKKSHPHIPIVAVTAYAMAEDKEKALSAGCNGYVAKPINQASLFAAINQCLKSKK
jgi:PAS domain S-box-containing protein